MKTILIAAAALTAMPAAAQAAVDAGSAGGAATAAASTAAVPAGVDTKRYCMIEDVTGSRLPLKVCKSRAEWRAEGVDILRTR